MKRYFPVAGRQDCTSGLVLSVAIAVLISGRCVYAQDDFGQRAYKQKCASCHGDLGEGTDEYPLPLTGTRSIAQLARFISKSMPKDEPGTCTGEEAKRVAAYIFNAFYSPLAQARNKPARLELSRLTVRQYQNAVADLIGSFRPPIKMGSEQGLRGEYFKSRRIGDGDRVLTRVDPVLDFDFGINAPAPNGFDSKQFSIRWQGSVLAPETGDYEFIIRTEHAARLYLNDLREPLIDAWVRSGNELEFRASRFLIAGRAYPIRLEFSKAKQGVDDSKKKEQPDVEASIELGWRPPKHSDQLIPTRYLVAESVSESMVVATPFPPDDRSVGYERGTSISQAWEAATTEAAIEVAGYVSDHLDELAGGGGSDRQEKLRTFCARFAERAFRRPLSEEMHEIYIDRRFHDAPDVETAVRRVVLLVLKSPRFLYRELGTGSIGSAAQAAHTEAAVRPDSAPDPYDVAARLSFALWDSLPDDKLLQAAAAGQLATREQIQTHAQRMLNDPRARAKLRAFFLQWLRVEHVPDLAKDPNQFPGFDRAIADDLRMSLDLFLERVVWSERSDFREILLADGLYLNGRLAVFYGADLPAGAPFEWVDVAGDERAGVLTHPYLMAAFAYTSTSSPIHRGVFLARSVLGRALKPPPEAFTPLPPELHPNLSTRERVMLQTKPEACTKCHTMINPLGFALENFDAIGRFRDKENGRALDTTGQYLARTGESVTFSGVRGLASYLAGSDEVHSAFVEQMFQYLIKQPIQAYGPGALGELKDGFRRDEFGIRNLAVRIAVLAAGIEQPITFEE